MMEIKFIPEGAEELVRELERIERRFPATTEKVLKDELRTIAGDLKRKTAEEINSHGRVKNKGGKGSTSTRKKKRSEVLLERSYAPGKVLMIHGDYRGAVTTKAPHYHLVEEGHAPGGWHAKQRRAQPVRGKKIVAAYMARRSERAQEIGERILEKVLDEAT